MDKNETANVIVNSASIRIMLSSGENSLGLFIEMLRRKPNRNPEMVVRTALSFRIVS